MLTFTLKLFVDVMIDFKLRSTFDVLTYFLYTENIFNVY